MNVELLMQGAAGRVVVEAPRAATKAGVQATFRVASAFGIGLIFGLGIAVSGMIDPMKVQNFFDVFSALTQPGLGRWDPSLAFVMGGALLATIVGYGVVLRARAPLLSHRFVLPTRRDIDGRLMAGAALFGIGWGIAGFCPGGAIPGLGVGHGETVTFVFAMAAGMWAARRIAGG